MPRAGPGSPAGGPFRVFCCRDRQAELPRRFFDRDRLPLPTGTRPGRLSGHYPAFRYYAVLRLLLGHQPSSFRSPAYRPTRPEPSRSPGVRRRDFAVITSPIRPRDRQEPGIAAGGQLTHPRDALRRFTLVRDHDASMASFRPALTEAPQRQPGRTGDRPVNSGPRPCLFDVGFPLSGPQVRTSTSDLNVHAQHTRARLRLAAGALPVQGPSINCSLICD